MLHEICVSTFAFGFSSSWFSITECGGKWCCTTLFWQMASIPLWPSNSSVDYCLQLNWRQLSAGCNLCSCFNASITRPLLKQKWFPQNIFLKVPWLQKGVLPSHKGVRSVNSLYLKIQHRSHDLQALTRNCLLFSCKLLRPKLKASVWMGGMNTAGPSEL